MPRPIHEWTQKHTHIATHMLISRTHQVIAVSAGATAASRLVLLLLVQPFGEPGHLVAALHLAEVQNVGAQLLCMCIVETVSC